jgi:hypothetical protein
MRLQRAEVMPRLEVRGQIAEVKIFRDRRQCRIAEVSPLQSEPLTSDLPLYTSAI